MKQDFPEVNGKIVDRVEISVDASHYGIAIRFQDKTALAFTIESCGVVAFPTYADWTDGEEKMLKESGPVRSETEARLKES